jgi:hypothetical protein
MPLKMICAAGGIKAGNDHIRAFMYSGVIYSAVIARLRPGDPVFQRRPRLIREAAAYWVPGQAGDDKW